MDFFTGIKKVYENLEQELSQSVSPGKKTDDADDSTHDLSAESSTNQVEVAASGDDGWGSWGEDESNSFRSPSKMHLDRNSQMSSTPMLPVTVVKHTEQSSSASGKAAPTSLGTSSSPPSAVKKPASKGMVLRKASRTSSSDDKPVDQLKTEGASAEQKDKNHGASQPPAEGSVAKPKTALSAPSTPGRGIDSMSREDLIKFVRKQMQLLKSTKAKCSELSETCNRLKEEKAQMKSPDSNDLKEKLSTVSGVRDQLAEQLRETMTERDKLKQDCKESRSELDGLMASKVEVERQLHSAVQERDDLRCTVERLWQADNQASDLEHRLEASVSECRKLQAHIKEVEEESARRLSQLEAERDQLGSQLSDVQGDLNQQQVTAERQQQQAGEEIKALRSHLSAVEKQLEDGGERERKLQTESEKTTMHHQTEMKSAQFRHQEEMEQLRAQLKETCDSKEREVTELRGQLSNSEKSKAELDSRVQSLMGTVSDVERSRGTLQAQLQAAAGKSDGVAETLSRQNSELEEQLSSLRLAMNQQVEELRAELHTAKADAQTAQERYETLERDIDQLTTNSQEALTERDEARADLDKLQTQSLARESSLQSLCEEHEQKVAELHQHHDAAMKEVVSRHAEEMKSVLDENEKLLAEMKEVQQQSLEQVDVEELCGQLSNARAEVERLTSHAERASQLETELAEARQQMTEVETPLTHTQSVVDENTAGAMVIGELRSSLEKSEVEKGNLSATVDNLQKELSVLRENHQRELACLQSANDVIQTELNERAAEVVDLEAKLAVVCKAEQELERLHEERRVSGKLQAEVETLKGVLDSQNDSLAERDSEIGRLRDELQQLQGVHSSVVGNLGTVREQLQKAGESGAQRAELEREVIELQGRIEQLEAKKGKEDEAQATLNSKLESVEQEHAKLQERFGKLRAMMVKLKGENSSLKSQLEASSTGGEETKKLRAELQSIQQDKTCLQLRLEEVEKKCGEQEEKLRLTNNECQALREKCQAEQDQASAHTTAVSELRSQLDGITKERGQLKEHIQLLQASKSSIEDALRTEQAAVASDRSRASQLVSEVEKLKAQLASEQAQHDDKTRQLETALKEAKKTDLMHLELADYERTITSLEERVEEKDRKLAETLQLLEKQEAIAETFKKEVVAVEQQRARSDDHVKKLKELLVKTKKELAEAHKQETVFRTREAELRGQLEVATQASESEKVEVSELAGELAKYQQQLQLAVESQKRTELVMDQRVASVQAELASARNALVAVQAEYETYKVRVHSVLKQQKQKPVDEDNVMSLKEMCDRHAAEAAQLRKELQDVTDALSVVQQERDDIEEEVQQLNEQYRAFSNECHQRESDQKTRYDKLHTEYVSVELERTEAVRQLGVQSETLTTTFKEQLHSLQQEHRSRLEIAQQQVDSLQEQLSSVQQQLAEAEEQKGSVSEHGGRQAAAVRPQPQHRAVVRPLTFLHNPPESKPAAQPTNDWEEVSDWSEVEETSRGPAQRNTVVTTLEKILSSAATPADDSTETASLVDAETSNLSRKLRSSSHQVQHLTELLNESEANTMRLTEQASILKEEIRRLERNQARQADLANLEYLKNVVIKFLHSDAKGQKELVPVLTRLLKLSPQEQKYIDDVCKGRPVEDAPKAVPDFAQAAIQQAGQLASYMHRWTGL